MSAAHKNESPIAVGRFVKSINSYATNFIAFCKRIATPDIALIAAFCLMTAQTGLMILGALS